MVAHAHNPYIFYLKINQRGRSDYNYFQIILLKLRYTVWEPLAPCDCFHVNYLKLKLNYG